MIRRPGLAAAALSLPAFVPAAASADNGVCESMSRGSSFKIEVCMQVRGSISDIVFTVEKFDKVTHLEGGTVKFVAYADGDSGQYGWSKPVEIGIRPAHPEAGWGCTGTIRGPFRPGSNLCFGWPDSGELHFTAERRKGDGTVIDFLESDAIGIDAAIKS